MLRLSYLIPRLLVLLLLLLLLRYGLDPVLKVTGQHFGSSAADAKVEIGQVSASLFGGTVYLKQVEVANRHKPMANLFQFEEAWFQLSNDALLERRVVVPHAIIRGLQFDTPRTESGELPAAEEDDSSDGSLFGEYGEFIASRATKGAKDWFADLENRLAGDLRNEFESIELSEQLLESWLLRSDQLRGDVARWQVRIEEYQELIRTVRANPLRHLELIAQRLSEVQTTHQELIRASQQIDELRRQLVLDKSALIAAKDHDVNKLRELSRIDKIDPRALSEYLLGDSLSGQLRTVLAWADRGRQAAELSLRRPDLNRQVGRGTFFPFAEAGSQIDFLIEQLAFSGHVDALSFAGQATGLTHQPKELGVPAVIELSTSGKVTSQVRAEVDLTSDDPVFHFVALCPEFPQPSRRLGDEDQFVVDVAPGPAAVRVDLTLTGNDITGDVRWRQDGLVMSPRLEGSRYAKVASVGLAQAFDKVHSFHAKVDLSGTLERPDWNLATNLGDQLSDGLLVAATQQLQQLADKLVGKLESEAASQFAQLDGLLAEQATQLSGSFESLQAIQQQLSGRWQLPIGKVGENLPFGELLR